MTGDRDNTIKRNIDQTKHNRLKQQNTKTHINVHKYTIQNTTEERNNKRTRRKKHVQRRALVKNKQITIIGAINQ